VRNAEAKIWLKSLRLLVSKNLLIIIIMEVHHHAAAAPAEIVPHVPVDNCFDFFK